MLTMQLPVSIFRTTWRHKGKESPILSLLLYQCNLWKYSSVSRCKVIQWTACVHTNLVATTSDSSCWCGVRLCTEMDIAIYPSAFTTVHRLYPTTTEWGHITTLVSDCSSCSLSFVLRHLWTSAPFLLLFLYCFPSSSNMCPFLRMSCFSEMNIPHCHTVERQMIFSISTCNSEMLRLEVIAKFSGRFRSEGLSKGHHWKLRIFQDTGFSIVCKIVVSLL